MRYENDLDVHFVKEIRHVIIGALVLAIETATAQGLGNVDHVAGMMTMAKGTALCFGIPWAFVVNDARAALGTGYDELLEAASGKMLTQ